MSAPAESLYVRPIFNRALSGDVLMPGHPLPRYTTLASLAYTSFAQGVLVDVEDTPLLGFRDRPSDAPGTAITALCDLNDGVPTLAGVEVMRVADEIQITFFDSTRLSCQDGLVIQTDYADYKGQFTDDLTQVRNNIATNIMLFLRSSPEG